MKIVIFETEPREAPAFDALKQGHELAHDAEKWEPVFGKDHAQTKC